MCAMKYVCPVCGYPELEEPPATFEICPCCGTEFGLDDADISHGELRRAWLLAGAPWFSQFTHAPAGWNPYRQILKAGLVDWSFVTPAGEVTSDVRKVQVGMPSGFIEFETAA